MAGAPEDTAPPAGPLTGEVLAFHFLPTRYMDPSWWQPPALPEPLLERLGNDPRCHRHLSRHLLEECGLDGSPDYDLPPAAVRLALMDRQRLDRLLLLAGLTLLSPSVACVLRRGERLRIKDSIGAGDYEFAVRRGRFLLQQSRLEGVLPTASPGDPGTLGRRCRRLGMGALAAALCDRPDSLIRRMQMRFPKAAVECHWRPLAAKPTEFMRLFALLDRRAPVV